MVVAKLFKSNEVDDILPWSKNCGKLDNRLNKKIYSAFFRTCSNSIQIFKNLRQRFSKKYLEKYMLNTWSKSYLEQSTVKSARRFFFNGEPSRF